MIIKYNYISTTDVSKSYTFTADGAQLPQVGYSIDAAVTNGVAVGTLVHREEVHTNEWNLFVSPPAAG